MSGWVARAPCVADVGMLLVRVGDSAAALVPARTAASAWKNRGPRPGAAGIRRCGWMRVSILPHQPACRKARGLRCSPMPWCCARRRSSVPPRHASRWRRSMSRPGVSSAARCPTTRAFATCSRGTSSGSKASARRSRAHSSRGRSARAPCRVPRRLDLWRCDQRRRGADSWRHGFYLGRAGAPALRRIRTLQAQGDASGVLAALGHDYIAEVMPMREQAAV